VFKIPFYNKIVPRNLTRGVVKFLTHKATKSYFSGFPMTKLEAFHTFTYKINYLFLIQNYLSKTDVSQKEQVT